MNLIRLLALTLIFSMLPQFLAAPSAMSFTPEQTNIHNQHEHHSKVVLSTESHNADFKCQDQCDMHDHKNGSVLDCSKASCTIHTGLMPGFENTFPFEFSAIHHFQSALFLNDVTFASPKKPPKNFS